MVEHIDDDATIDPSDTASDDIEAIVEGLDDATDVEGDEYDDGGDEYESDPFASWLMRVVLLLLVVLLGSALALVVYVVNLREAPRTALERSIAQAEVAVQEHPELLENWIEYAYSLAKAGRVDEAYRVLEKGRGLIDRSAALDVAEADILRMDMRYEDAVAAYDVASKAAIEQHEAYIQELADQGIVMNVTNTALMEAHVGRAYALIELGRDEEAIAELEYALEIDEMAADLWAVLGDLYAGSDDPDSARSAYEEALRYVPDLQQAIDGLELLEGER